MASSREMLGLPVKLVHPIPFHPLIRKCASQRIISLGDRKKVKLSSITAMYSPQKRPRMTQTLKTLLITEFVNPKVHIALTASMAQFSKASFFLICLHLSRISTSSHPSTCTTSHLSVILN